MAHEPSEVLSMQCKAVLMCFDREFAGLAAWHSAIFCTEEAPLSKPSFSLQPMSTEEREALHSLTLGCWPTSLTTSHLKIDIHTRSVYM